MTMLIEVEGIGFPNKGAELMLCAVESQLREQYRDDVQICCRPWQGHKESYRLLGNRNILQLGYLTCKGIRLDGLFNWLPLKITETFGIARAKDVDVVLDASGLRYSDSWGPKASRAAAVRYRKLKKKGKKIIILPQAFGPFKNPEVGSAVREIVELSDLCFARDEVSYRYLVELCGEDVKIQQAPDFTNLVEPISAFGGSEFYGKVIIVPNQRMIDKTDKSVADNYFKYLLNLCTYLRELGEDVIILNHEGKSDHLICMRLSKACGNLPVVTHWDPVYIKTVIGCCKLLVSSRFHGCVSALSQGVPVIATSWSHKYEMLLKEYGVEDYLVHLSSDTVDAKMVQSALQDSTSRQIVSEAGLLKLKSRDMWSDVFKFLSSQCL